MANPRFVADTRGSVLAFRARPLEIPSAADVGSFEAFEAWVRALAVPQRGPAWESFTEAYLCLTPTLGVQDVWRPADPYLPDDVLTRLGLERQDVGQDFVVRTRGGALWIVQAKFRSSGALTWEDLRGAIAAGRNADRVLFVSNATAIGGNYPPGILNEHAGVVLRHDLLPLDRTFFDAWEAVRAGRLKQVVAEGRRDHQAAAVRDVVAEFRAGASRAQLIAACGTGKTRMGLWVMEDLDAKRVVFFAPSLALVSQTVGEWTAHASTPIDVICVCSDASAGDMSAYEVAVPVTTNADRLRAQWDAPLEEGRRRVMFVTYHSASVLADALRASRAPRPALIVCDEAHRVAGDEDKSWQLVLDDDAIPTTHRLFMTATPRIIAPEIRAALAAEGIGASMDDEALFGRVAHRITFRDAINAGMLADYRIHVIGVPTNERRVKDMVRRRKFVLGSEGARYEPMLNGKKRPFDAGEVAQAIALERAFDRGLFRYAFTFHSRVAYARRFITLIELLWREDVRCDTALGVVTGEMPLRERRALLERSLQRPMAVIGSVQALSEGVDVPAVDAVVFSDPKESVIAIVQAIGRALRKRPGAANKTASIVIPVPVPNDEDPDEVINGTAWKTVWNVLEAMAQHDGEFAEHLATLRRELGGRSTRGSAGLARQYVQERLEINLPDHRSFDALRNAVDIAVIDRGAWAFWHMLRCFRHWSDEDAQQIMSSSCVLGTGERLGLWVDEMRLKHAEGRLKDTFERALADTPGWYWSEHDERWMKELRRHEAYLASHDTPVGRLLPPGDPGHETVRWLQRQQLLASKGALKPEYLAAVECLPGWGTDSAVTEFVAMIALAKDGVKEGVDATTERDSAFRRASLQRYLDGLRRSHRAGKLRVEWSRELERLPGWTWTPKQDRDARLEAEAIAFKGHHTELAFAIPKTLTPELKDLRRWCNEQRRLYANGNLDSDRAARLGSLATWEWVAGLKAFAQRVELLRPMMTDHYAGYLPAGTMTVDNTGEAVDIGAWVETQRRAYLSKTLHSEAAAMLESLPGWRWRGGESFAKTLAGVRAFVAVNGTVPIPEAYRDERGNDVGQAASALRSAYRSNRLKDGEQIRLLEAIPGWTWDRLTDHQERMLELVAEFGAAHGDLLPGRTSVGPANEPVGRWVSTQLSARDKGTLSAWLARRLEQIPAWERGERDEQVHAVAVPVRSTT